MKKYLLMFVLTLSLQHVFAQDQIVKINGDELAGRVLEITLDEVRFQHPDSLKGIIWTVPKSEVFMVRFANGTKEVFSDNLTDSANATEALSADDSYLLGKTDAIRYYTGNGALWGSAASTFLMFPYGLAGPLIIGAAQPKAHKNKVSDVQLLSNPHYVQGYQEQAHKRKVGKAAAGAGIGTLAIVGVVYLFINSIQSGR